VLINSFYGYLGYSRAIFNDFDAAERVTLRGQELIQHLALDLEHEGAEPIEIDTDGIYFRPPDSVKDLDREEAFVAGLAARMPEGISLAHDGSFRGMLSLKTKNYALLTHDDRLVLKGSSLRSRRDERVFRRFLREAARQFITGAFEDTRDRYFQFAEEIMSQRLPIEEISRWEMVTEKTFTSEANRRLATAAGEERIGERLAVYQRTDGELARIEQYQHDEDIDYLLRRLRDMAQRFRALFDDDASFNYVFPVLTSRTDLNQLRTAPLVRQASLFS
jgi:DNA polymerase elongation subunit (family B)